MSINFASFGLVDNQFNNNAAYYEDEKIIIDDCFDITESKTLNVDEILDGYFGRNLLSNKNNDYNACNEGKIDLDLVDEIENFFSSEKINLAIEEVNSEVITTKKRKFSDTNFEEANKEVEVVKEIKKSNKRPKRPKPQFIISESFFSRINNYWNVINKNEKYRDLLERSSVLYKEYKFNPISSDIFLKNVIPILLPNNIGITFFDSVQGIDGWYYELNNKRQQGKLAMRWCGQELNFYDPFVTRHKLDKHGKVIKKQALCPYCPVENTMNLDYVFHNTQDSLYMHHVCKDHGVYSSGYELEPPLFFYDKGLPIAYCTECGEKCRMFNLGTGIENCMIAYFRHSFVSHNKKKQKRTLEQKKHDNYLFNNNKRKRFVYENFKQEKVAITSIPSTKKLSIKHNSKNVVGDNLCHININIEKKKEETNKIETVTTKESIKKPTRESIKKPIKELSKQADKKLSKELDKEESDMDIVDFILEDYPEEESPIRTPEADSSSVESPVDESLFEDIEECNLVDNTVADNSVLINDVKNDSDFNFDFTIVENENEAKSIKDLIQEIDGAGNPFTDFMPENKPMFSFDETKLEEKEFFFDGIFL